MSDVVQVVRRENRLGRLLSRPGGMKISAAIREAEQNLFAIRDETLAEVDRNIQLLRRSAIAAAADAAAQAEVYAHANVIAGLAGSCGSAALGQAAFLLCELADGYVSMGEWNTDAVAVCLNAIMLVRGGGVRDYHDDILSGLEEMVAKARRSLDASLPRSP